MELTPQQIDEWRLKRDIAQLVAGNPFASHGPSLHVVMADARRRPRLRVKPHAKRKNQLCQKPV